MGPRLCHQSPATMDIRHNYDYAVDSSKGKITSASVTILAQDLERGTVDSYAETRSMLPGLMNMMQMLLNGLAAATGGALCQACC